MDINNQELASIIMSQSSIGDPIRYAHLVKATKSPTIEMLRKLLPALKKQLDIYEQTAKKAAELKKNVSGEGYARRRKDAKKIFEGLDQQADLNQNFDLDISSLLASHYDSVSVIYSHLVQGAEMIANAKMITTDDSISQWGDALKSNEDELGVERITALLSKASEAKTDALNSLAMEQRINQGATQSFIHGLMLLEKIPAMYESYLHNQARNFEMYYEKLRQRHSNGMVIASLMGIPSVTLTDVSLLIWNNIDKVGEIESGHSKDELSAYTLHRANAMLEAAKRDTIWQWIGDPGNQLKIWAEGMLPTMKSIQDTVIDFKQMLGESTWRLLSKNLEKATEEFIDVIESLDLSQITQRDPERAFSKTEKFALEHRNTSIQTVAELIAGGHGIQTVVDQILALKVQERNFYMNENSFYVCKIGQGNMFTGIAPGGLEVIPGEKPNASLDNIWGAGFDELRSFIGSQEEIKKWQPLFLSTSPSKSTDKNNILLIGPQGCGKTEVMRALASSSDSISIFAVGSNFLTAWAGESNKNVSRLFDEAVRLHKASGKHVYLLIDEVDSVLNNDHGSTKINLTTEFQNLMDGVVAYPGISVIAATNHFSKIPIPMVRRFAKTLLVGELSEEETKHTLKYYLENFLPCKEGFSDEQYTQWAKRFEGATGDLLRKMIDEVWLSFMRTFISNNKERSEEILKYLQDQYGENFEISQLTNENRLIIKNMISEIDSVSVELVNQESDKLLNNFAIQQQIKTSKETYKEARKMLAKQKAKDASLGF